HTHVGADSREPTPTLRERLQTSRSAAFGQRSMAIRVRFSSPSGTSSTMTCSTSSSSSSKTFGASPTQIALASHRLRSTSTFISRHSLRRPRTPPAPVDPDTLGQTHIRTCSTSMQSSRVSRDTAMCRVRPFHRPEAPMQISYTPEQEALRAELREYFARLITPERREALAVQSGEYGEGDVYREVVREMGRDGWLALGWPEEFGGQNRSSIDQLIFTDEAAIAGAPVPFLTINSVAPTIMHFGTEEQKAFFLPKIAAGEIHFAIGYSEPESGTDLASLRTSAVRDSEDWIVNGQKMWTSLIAYADYVWLAARTDPEAKKHRGISMLIVPTTAEGFSWTPVHTMAGPDTSATYYQDVRVPDSARVGAVNEGW